MYRSYSLKGKIALIQRAGEENGEVLTFAQKESNAKNAGAIAAIIYDNVDGALINMSTETKYLAYLSAKPTVNIFADSPIKNFQ